MKSAERVKKNARVCAESLVAVDFNGHSGALEPMAGTHDRHSPGRATATVTATVFCGQSRPDPDFWRTSTTSSLCEADRMT